MEEVQEFLDVENTERSPKQLLRIVQNRKMENLDPEEGDVVVRYHETQGIRTCEVGKYRDGRLRDIITVFYAESCREISIAVKGPDEIEEIKGTVLEEDWIYDKLKQSYRSDSD